MGKVNAQKLLKTVRVIVDKHSPEILTGIGIAGMVTATVLAVKVTPKAIKLVEMEKARINRELIKEAAENGDENCEQVSSLTPVEVVKVTWKCYIPVVIATAASISCLIGASSVNIRRNAALATAYKLSETAFTEYQDKVKAEVGDKKEEHIREKVAEEKIKNNPISSNEVIITDNGNTLCFDSISGRYFKSSMEQIKRAENILNKQMINEMYISLNDFYDALGLECTDIGDQLGWNIDNGLIEFDFHSQIAEDGTPCLVVNYRLAPKYNFSKYL